MVYQVSNFFKKSISNKSTCFFIYIYIKSFSKHLFWSMTRELMYSNACGRLLATVLQNAQRDALSKEFPPDLQKERSLSPLKQNHPTPFSEEVNWAGSSTDDVSQGSICVAGSSSPSWLHLLSAQLAVNEAGTSGQSPSCFLFFCSSLGLK